MGYLQLFEEVAHSSSEPHEDLSVQLGVVVFEDDLDVDVVLVVRAGPVFGRHIIDDELMGQVLGEFGSDDAGDFSSVSVLAVMLPTPGKSVAVG